MQNYYQKSFKIKRLQYFTQRMSISVLLIPSVFSERWGIKFWDVLANFHNFFTRPLFLSTTFRRKRPQKYLECDIYCYTVSPFLSKLPAKRDIPDPIVPGSSGYRKSPIVLWSFKFLGMAIAFTHGYWETLPKVPDYKNKTGQRS